MLAAIIPRQCLVDLAKKVNRIKILSDIVKYKLTGEELLIYFNHGEKLKTKPSL